MNSISKILFQLTMALSTISFVGDVGAMDSNQDNNPNWNDVSNIQQDDNNRNWNNIDDIDDIADIVGDDNKIIEDIDEIDNAFEYKPKEIIVKFLGDSANLGTHKIKEAIEILKREEARKKTENRIYI